VKAVERIADVMTPVTVAPDVDRLTTNELYMLHDVVCERIVRTEVGGIGPSMVTTHKAWLSLKEKLVLTTLARKASGE